MSEIDNILDRFKREGSSESELLDALEKDGYKVKRQYPRNPRSGSSSSNEDAKRDQPKHRDPSVILGAIAEIVAAQGRIHPSYTNTRLIELIDELTRSITQLTLETAEVYRELATAMSTITEAANACERIGRE